MTNINDFTYEEKQTALNEAHKILNMKIFKFAHSEGAEILVANNAKEAIMYYFTGYQDDINTDAICETEGIKIEELQGETINKKHEIFNEEQGDVELVSYKELAEAAFKGHPVVIVTPNY